MKYWYRNTFYILASLDYVTHSSEAEKLFPLVCAAMMKSGHKHNIVTTVQQLLASLFRGNIYNAIKTTCSDLTWTVLQSAQKSLLISTHRYHWIKIKVLAPLLITMVCFPAQVVPFRRAVQSAGTPSEGFRAVCVCWLWITNLSTWSRCSKGCWETTATCRSTCVESLTGQSQGLSALGSTSTFSHVRMFLCLMCFLVRCDSFREFGDFWKHTVIEN